MMFYEWFWRSSRSRFPPSHPLQTRFWDLQVLMFDPMGHTTPPTHRLSPVADHSTRPISPRHRKPPCCHPSTTHPAGGGAPSQGPDGARRSAGPRASGHPPIRLESGKASGGERLRCRGEGSLSRVDLCCCLGRFCLEGMSRWEVGGSWRSGLTATPSWKEISLVLARVLSRLERWCFILFSFYKCFL